VEEAERRGTRYHWLHVHDIQRSEKRDKDREQGSGWVFDSYSQPVTEAGKCQQKEKLALRPLSPGSQPRWMLSAAVRSA